MPMHAAVRVEDVHKWYGSLHAVRGVSFELPKAQVAGLLGHNGAGKSTLIRMIAGFLTPDHGVIEIDGVDVETDRRSAAARIGYLPESTPLYPEARVEDYLHFRGRLFGMPWSARGGGVSRVVEQCWLKDVRKRRIGELSKGYRQRVGLAAALLHDPPVLVLDEPTSGLDPTQVREMRGLIRGLASERTMLISSHVLPEVEMLCDRVMIVASGKLRADGAVADLASRFTPGGLEVEALVHDEHAAGRFVGALGAIAGVTRVDQRAVGPGGWRRYAVHAAAGVDVREGVARAAQGACVTLREIAPTRATLEAVFVRVLEESAAEGTA